MKTSKKKALLLLTVSSFLILAAGCSKSNSQDQAAQADSGNSSVAADSGTAQDDSTLNGQVTAVDGSTITLSAWPGGGNRGPGNGENKGQRPNGDSKNSDNMTPPDKSADSNNSNSTGNDKNSVQPTPSGDNQNGNGNKMPQGEEKTITVTDSTTYSVEKDGKTTAGSISDVTVDSMISVEFTTDSSGKEVPSVITIRSFSRDGMGKGGNNSDSQTDNSNTK